MPSHQDRVRTFAGIPEPPRKWVYVEVRGHISDDPVSFNSVQVEADDIDQAYIKGRRAMDSANMRDTTGHNKMRLLNDYVHQVSEYFAA